MNTEDMKPVIGLAIARAFGEMDEVQPKGADSHIEIDLNDFYSYRDFGHIEVGTFDLNLVWRDVKDAPDVFGRLWRVQEKDFAEGNPWFRVEISGEALQRAAFERRPTPSEARAGVERAIRRTLQELTTTNGTPTAGHTVVMRSSDLARSG